MSAPRPSTGLLGALAFALQRPPANTASDEYLRRILAREIVDQGPFSDVHLAHRTLAPILERWAGFQLSHLALSGSFAKGTANHSSTDVDLLVSLYPWCTTPLAEIHKSLARQLSISGYQPKLQGVSIGVDVFGLQVDVVPARQHTLLTSDHSIYLRKRQSWRKTNINKHIEFVRGSGCLNEIRLIKLWRDQHRLEFPSFLLELAVIRALRSVWYGTLSQRLLAVFDYLATQFPNHRFEDPANTANIISDDLTLSEKLAIQRQARLSLQQPWACIVR